MPEGMQASEQARYYKGNRRRHGSKAAPEPRVRPARASTDSPALRTSRGESCHRGPCGGQELQKATDVLQMYYPVPLEPECQVCTDPADVLISQLRREATLEFYSVLHRAEIDHCRREQLRSFLSPVSVCTQAAQGERRSGVPGIRRFPARDIMHARQHALGDMAAQAGRARGNGSTWEAAAQECKGLATRQARKSVGTTAGGPASRGQRVGGERRSDSSSSRSAWKELPRWMAADQRDGGCRGDRGR
jgi:hypothetical protein